MYLFFNDHWSICFTWKKKRHIYIYAHTFALSTIKVAIIVILFSYSYSLWFKNTLQTQIENMRHIFIMNNMQESMLSALTKKNSPQITYQLCSMLGSPGFLQMLKKKPWIHGSLDVLLLVVLSSWCTVEDNF